MNPRPRDSRPPAGPNPSDPTTIYEETAKRVLREDPRQPDALFTLAASLAVSGEPAQALDLLHRLVSIDPGYPGVWRVIARVYRLLGVEAAARRCERTADRYWV